MPSRSAGPTSLPSFPRRRESLWLWLHLFAVIPARAGIAPALAPPLCRHSRVGGNRSGSGSISSPSFPRRRESLRLWPHLFAVIPAKAEIALALAPPLCRHSREGGNRSGSGPTFLPSFPRRRKSRWLWLPLFAVIPAKAGIAPALAPPFCRHSREGGNRSGSGSGFGFGFGSDSGLCPDFTASTPPPLLPLSWGIQTMHTAISLQFFDLSQVFTTVGSDIEPGSKSKNNNQSDSRLRGNDGRKAEPGPKLELEPKPKPEPMPERFPPSRE